MGEPTLDQRTPNLRLKYAAEAGLNYNWEKLDDFAGLFRPTGKSVSLNGPWAGDATTTEYSLVNGQEQQIATVETDPTERPDKWSIVVGQFVFQIQYGTPGISTSTLTLGVYRGASQSLGTRHYAWSTSAAVEGLDLDIPLTVPLIVTPGDASAIYRVTAIPTYTGGSIIMHRFSQLWALQFR